MKTIGRNTTATVLGTVLSLGLVFSANPAFAFEADEEGISSLGSAATVLTDVEADSEGMSATGMIAPDGTVVPDGMSIEEFEASQQPAPAAVKVAPAEKAAPASTKTAPMEQAPPKATAGKANALPAHLLEVFAS